jgi:hypothetical protein
MISNRSLYRLEIHEPTRRSQRLRAGICPFVWLIIFTKVYFIMLRKPQISTGSHNPHKKRWLALYFLECELRKILVVFVAPIWPDHDGENQVPASPDERVYLAKVPEPVRVRRDWGRKTPLFAA